MACGAIYNLTSSLDLDLAIQLKQMDYSPNLPSLVFNVLSSLRCFALFSSQKAKVNDVDISVLINKLLPLPSFLFYKLWSHELDEVGVYDAIVQ